MIRETDDVNISNAERAEMTNRSGADIFVRVHANSLSDTSVHGALTMCRGHPKIPIMEICTARAQHCQRQW